MERIVFKFYDEFFFGELLRVDNDESWFRVNAMHDIGFDTNTKILYYSCSLREITRSMFNIGTQEFIEIFKKWFEDRFNLKVNSVVKKKNVPINFFIGIFVLSLSRKIKILLYEKIIGITIRNIIWVIFDWMSSRIQKF